MFWFAGLVGMAIESKRVRRWMAPAASIADEEPPSYKASFNPFPALVIGVTGIAMAAHFQPFRFQVGHNSCRLIIVDSYGVSYRSKFTHYGETCLRASLFYAA